MKSIFHLAINGDLLKLVHLLNGFQMIGDTKTIQARDVCHAEVHIISITNANEGKIVKIKGYICCQGTKVIKVVSLWSLHFKCISSKFNWNRSVMMPSEIVRSRLTISRTPQSQLSCLAPRCHLLTLTEQTQVSWRLSLSLTFSLYTHTMLIMESLLLFRSPEKASTYICTFQVVLWVVDSSDGNMEQVWKLNDAQVIRQLKTVFLNSLQCDVNVSVNYFGCSLETCCKIKNINSVRLTMATISWVSSFPPLTHHFFDIDSPL